MKLYFNEFWQYSLNCWKWLLDRINFLFSKHSLEQQEICYHMSPKVRLWENSDATFKIVKILQKQIETISNLHKPTYLLVTASELFIFEKIIQTYVCERPFYGLKAKHPDFYHSFYWYEAFCYVILFLISVFKHISFLLSTVYEIQSIQNSRRAKKMAKWQKPR